MGKFFCNIYAKHLSKAESGFILSIIFCIVSLIAFMGDILAPYIASIVIAYILDYPISILLRKKIPYMAALMIVFVVFICLILLIIFILIPILWEQLENLFVQLPVMFSSFKDKYLFLSNKYFNYSPHESLQSTISNFNMEIKDIAQYILSISISSIPSFFNFLLYVLLLPLIVYLLLFDKHRLLLSLNKILPKNIEFTNKICSRIHLELGCYIRGKCIEVLIITILTFILLSIFQLKYTILLSVLSGITVLIPIIGAFIATIPVTVVALFQWGATSDFVYLIISYGILVLFDGNILAPWIFYETIKMHPLATIFSISLFGGIFGFWGIFFAIPLFIVCRAVLNDWPTSSNSSAIL